MMEMGGMSRTPGIEGLFSDSTLSILSKSLDAASLNHILLTNNIANVNTPGFKRSEISFKDQLASLLSGGGAPGLERSLSGGLQPGGLSGFVTHPRHLPIGPAQNLSQLKPIVKREADTTMRADGSNVDVDVEMARLAENSLDYSALVNLVRRKFSSMRASIEGRGI